MQRDLPEEIEGRETGNIVQSRDVGIPIPGIPKMGSFVPLKGMESARVIKMKGWPPGRGKDGRKLPVNIDTRSGE